MKRILTAAVILAAGAAHGASFNGVEVSFTGLIPSDFNNAPIGSSNLDLETDIKPNGDKLVALGVQPVDTTVDATPGAVEFSYTIPNINVEIVVDLFDNFIKWQPTVDVMSGIPSLPFFGFSIHDVNDDLPNFAGVKNAGSSLMEFDDTLSFVTANEIFINLDGLTSLTDDDFIQVEIAFVPLPAAAPMAAAAFGALAFAARRRRKD